LPKITIALSNAFANYSDLRYPKLLELLVQAALRHAQPGAHFGHRMISIRDLLDYLSLEFFRVRLAAHDTSLVASNLWLRDA
jgi:hypothetical protein